MKPLFYLITSVVIEDDIYIIETLSGLSGKNYYYYIDNECNLTLSAYNSLFQSDFNSADTRSWCHGCLCAGAVPLLWP